jgi:purine-binding chemotaxis protein CheW
MSDKALDQIPVLTFMMGDKQYALLIEHVVEVAAMVQYSYVVDSILALLGMINRHGQVMPLIDLRIVFGLITPVIDTNVLFIVAQYEDTLVGLVVDTVNQVEYIYPSDLRVAPGGGRWVEQVASYQDDLLQIINLPAVIANLLPETLTAQQEIEDKF